MPTFDWKAGWPEFRENLAAVRWLVQGTAAGAGRAPGQEIPDDVREMIDRYVGLLRVNAVGSYSDDLRLRVV